MGDIEMRKDPKVAYAAIQQDPNSYVSVDETLYPDNFQTQVTEWKKEGMKEEQVQEKAVGILLEALKIAAGEGEEEEEFSCGECYWFNACLCPENLAEAMK